MIRARLTVAALTIAGCWLASAGAWYAAAGALGIAVTILAISHRPRRQPPENP